MCTTVSCHTKVTPQQDLGKYKIPTKCSTENSTIPQNAKFHIYRPLCQIVPIDHLHAREEWCLRHTGCSVRNIPHHSTKTPLCPAKNIISRLQSQCPTPFPLIFSQFFPHHVRVPDHNLVCTRPATYFTAVAQNISIIRLQWLTTVVPLQRMYV